MTSSRSVVLAAPVRTAIGTFGGSLKEVSAPDLGAVAIGAAVERAGLEPGEKCRQTLVAEKPQAFATSASAILRRP
jgi:acetyl-CoA C-acetyltransferase